MRKSERLRQLELSVQRMEIIIDLMQMTMSNLLESQGMEAPSDLDSGKWYKKIQKNY